MKAFVGFIWTNSRDVDGQWRYELKKNDLLTWVQTNAISRDFQCAELFNNLSDIKRVRAVLNSTNASIETGPGQGAKNYLAAIDSFLAYVHRTQSSLFIDNQAHDR